MGGRSGSFSKSSGGGGGGSVKYADLEGTDKQVSWANDIRDRYKKAYDTVAGYKPETATDAEKTKPLLIPKF